MSDPIHVFDHTKKRVLKVNPVWDLDGEFHRHDLSLKLRIKAAWLVLRGCTATVYEWPPHGRHE